jgi:acetyl esterase/lipase
MDFLTIPSPSREEPSMSPTNARIRPPFDRELAAVLAAFPRDQWAGGSVLAESIPGLRSADLISSPTAAQLARDGAVRVEEITIPGPAAAPDLALLVLRPSGQAGPAPLIYHTHGGGMVSGTRWSSADSLAAWVEVLGVVGVAVEYRLAPEHPHPAPVEDCYAGLCWLAGHADEMRIDASQIIIWGASAGGGLAAATALLARDRGGPALAHQILECPMIDDRCTTSSSHELHEEGVWDRTSNITGWTALLGDSRGGADVSPYAAPARAENLRGLPPTFLDVGQVETFRDETIDYAMRLSQAGVPVELHVWPGAWHGFENMAPGSALAKLSNAARLAYLQRVLAR